MRALVLLFVASGALAACGGSDPVCGDATAEGDEACDDGNTNENDGCTSNCAVAPSTEVHIEWSVASQELDGFNETCPGVGAQHIELTFTGAENRTELVNCTFMNTFVRGLAPGDYQLSARLLDAGGESLVRAPTKVSFRQDASMQAMLVLDFPFAAFERDYEGTFFFRVKWDGEESCAGVAEYAVRLERDGAPLRGTFRGEGGGDQDVTFDGQTSWPCHAFAEEFPEALRAVPWGPARITITGSSSSGTTLFEGSFDTFVGAGLSNPEVIFDVMPAVAAP